jgi:hypothetical protein
VTETKDGELILAVVTDEATGLFVQLGGTVKKKEGNTNLLLTYGKKFLMEIQPLQLNNTAVKIWS